MAKRAEVKMELTAEVLHEKYRKAKDPVKRTHWHILCLGKEGNGPREVAERLGYTAGWVRALVCRWNEAGRQGIIDHRRAFASGEAAALAQPAGRTRRSLADTPFR